MEEENLTISPSLITIAYKFRNKTESPITTLITFSFTVEVNGKSQSFQTKISKKDGDLLFNHFWEQTFSPNSVTEIKHTYRPIFSSSVLDSEPVIKLKPGQVLSTSAAAEALKKDYCTSEKEASWVAEKQALYKSLTYIVMTAKTWDGPIGRFRLRIQKESYSAIFLCTELKLTKSPDGKSFEVLEKNYVPKKDLRIAFVKARLK